jgi:hypothetical protein
VPATSHRSRRRNQRRSRFRLLTATACIALAALGVLVFSWTRANVVDPENAVGRSVESDFEFDEIAASDLASRPSQRPNYRYSVIPGGAYDALELRTAIQNDPVVAAHYEQIDQSKLRVERVARDRYVHVSYRKGNQILWTRNKVLLRQGETILTDGQTQIRARCGNCISDDPGLPTAAEEPETVEFDRLTDAPRPGEIPIVPIVPVASLSENPAIIGAVPAAGLPEPLAVGRSSLGGAPTPLIGSKPTDGGSAPSPDGPGGGTPRPFDVPPPFGATPGLPGLYDPLPGDNLFPPPPGTPSIPPGFEIGFPPPGGGPELPPPWITDLTPSGSPEEPVNPVPVPEPGTLLLVGGGVAMLLRRLRSRAS